MSDLGNLVSDLGGAVSSLFNASGNAAQAKDFQGAATLATQNAQLSAASTRIQETQTARTVAQSLGTTQADVSGAGFTMSGSALDILKSSAEQGSLAKSLVNIQGAMNENSYAAQAGAYSGEAKAAKEASTAGTIGAIASLGGALISGSGALASVGKTVVQGYNTVAGLFGTGGAQASDVGSGISLIGAGPLAAEGPAGAVASGIDLSGGTGVGSGLAADWGSSATDLSIQSGATLSDAASAGIGIDTSGVAIGDSASAVSSAVGDAFTSLSDSVASSAADAAASLGIDSALASTVIGDFIPGLNIALLADMIPGVSDIPVVGPALDAISSGVGDVVNGVVSTVSSIGSAIGSVFSSVICTALYRRRMLTRSVWWGAQKYGRDVAPEHIYTAYLLWGRPIARMIDKSEMFTQMVAPVFIPWANELAVLAGEETAKSTRAGRVIFKVTYAFSSLLGHVILYKRGFYVSA